MTMQTTKAHRNGPHRNRKSGRAAAARPAQAEMFALSEDGDVVGSGAEERADRASRAQPDVRRGAAVGHRASFGSFSRAKVRVEPPAPAIGLSTRSGGREEVSGALAKFGLRRLGGSADSVSRLDESTPPSSRVESARGSGVDDAAGEELPPLVPSVVSTCRADARSRRVSRFAVPLGGRSDVQLAAETHVGLGARVEVLGARVEAQAARNLESTMIPVAADVRPVTRAARRARLTVRGHIAVMVLIATVIAGASALVNASGAGTAPVAATQEVLVKPGDTVGSIASRFAAPAHRADLVALIRAANGLSGSVDAPLPAGDYLIVPAY
ncbi:LysM domain-containing protein [Antricoccus suffuscus]|uniref:LysM domain-containing protein n=1 Tax=Antricoccus suffuscus TaxID=1629062 RepID=A0A2T1A4V5_9ACTN|nr:LysM peptidoglycan-binding domain-containing protein [Antricoccus suffuscus]PRZ43635.1 LysM domain-containing protein [Antricoccus suffuscus]